MVKNPADSPNIVPGEHELVFDCRILPRYSIDKLLKNVEELAREIKKRYAERSKEKIADIEFEILQRVDAPPPTDPNSPIVKLLQRAIKEIRGKETYVGGIGSFTVALPIRKLGIPTAVWATLDETAHQVNEYAKIKNMIEDAKIMAAIALI